jgi:predicted amidohydrolase
MTAERFRIGVAQPRMVAEPEAERNVDRAIEMIARSAAAEARLILFPEGSPGPYRPSSSYDGRARLAEAAAANGIAVCWSRVERCDDGHHRLVVYVVDAGGNEVLRYERSHPATLPPSETGAWIAPGERLGAFELEGVRFGVVVCSELWVPEPARVLAIRGAEILLSPAGGRFTTLTANWQVIARARAIENLCYVALTNNLFAEEYGAAMIAGPEDVLASSGVEELLFATLDLARVRWLRDRDDSIADPKPFSSIPGLLRARRPHLYGDLAQPAGDLFDYETPPVTEAQRETVATG